MVDRSKGSKARKKESKKTKFGFAFFTWGLNIEYQYIFFKYSTVLIYEYFQLCNCLHEKSHSYYEYSIVLKKG